jgi:hypothetical protein
MVEGLPLEVGRQLIVPSAWRVTRLSAARAVDNQRADVTVEGTLPNASLLM